MSTSGRMHMAKRGRPCSGLPEERLNGEKHSTDKEKKVEHLCCVQGKQTEKRGDILLQ
jgi:hypothetical protein